MTCLWNSNGKIFFKSLHSPVSMGLCGNFIKRVTYIGSVGNWTLDLELRPKTFTVPSRRLISLYVLFPCRLRTFWNLPMSFVTILYFVTHKMCTDKINKLLNFKANEKTIMYVRVRACACPCVWWHYWWFKMKYVIKK